MTTTTTTRPTYALQEGDIVWAHGCRLRLHSKRAIGHLYRDMDLSACAFSTEYVGPTAPDRDPIAEHGPYGRMMVRGEWTIQGNARASWTVEA